MNIADKPALFAETRRVLKPGATFALYDIMRLAPGDLPYPMPWAAVAETSFLAAPEDYRAMLAEAGFALVSERDRRAFVLEVRQRRREAAERGERPPGLGAINGPDFAVASANIQTAIEAGTLGPVEMIARAI
jgi:hypothetical protein